MGDLVLSEHEVLNEQQRGIRLDREIADWSRRGYKLVSRSASSAQLGKPKGSLVVPVVILLVVSALLGLIAGPLWGCAVFVLGLLFMVLAQAGRKESLVYLRVDVDGSVIED